MINNLLKIVVLTIFLSVSKRLNAEKIFHVHIQIPPGINGKSFFINYDDGVKSHLVVDSFKNNILEFHGNFTSKYATLTIKYNVNDSLSFDDRYFIGTKPVELDFLIEDSTVDRNPFHNCNVKNAIEIDKTNMSINRSIY